MRRHRGIPGIVYVDFLAAMLSIFVALLFLALVQQKRYTVPPALRTPGIYAITTTTQRGRMDDVDLYVRGPGGVAYFSSPEAGLLHLEHDVIPGITEGSGSVHGQRCDCERTIIRGVQPGRYDVSVQMYSKATDGPSPVTVTLYKLIGADRKVYEVHVELGGAGSEAPAFQFSLNPDGSVSGFTRLPIKIAGGAWG